MPFGKPKWKEIYNIRYKYYYDNDIEVEFDISKKKLTLTCYKHDFKETYDIKYPRFTSRGIHDKSRYYQFFFSVMDQQEEVVIVIRADNIKNYHELCTTNLHVQVTSENNIFTKKNILKYQETIYRDLGINMGLKDIAVDPMDLSRIGMTRDEFDYGIYSLMFRTQNEYLCDIFRCLGIGKHKFLELIDRCDKAAELMETRVEAIGLSREDFMEIRYLMEIDKQISLKKKAIEEAMEDETERLNRRLIQIGKRLENLIYLDKIPSLSEGRNILQTLRIYGMDIHSVDMKELTKKFLKDVEMTGLSVMEMLEMVFNYRRSIPEALRVEDSQRDVRLGLAMI